MRKSTLITASVATLSALYTAQNIAVGNQPEIVAIQPVTSESTIDQGANRPDSNQTSPASGTTDAEQELPKEEPTAPVTGENNTEPVTQAQAKEPQPAPQPVEEAVAAPPQVEKTMDSDPITYQYGVVQISMTQLNGKITNVSLLQGDTSYGRDQAYAALIDATVAAQGTNFGNYSGATFTTDAFREAVGNVMSKF